MSEGFQQIPFSEKEEPSRMLRAEVQMEREGLGAGSWVTWGTEMPFKGAGSKTQTERRQPVETAIRGRSQLEGTTAAPGEMLSYLDPQRQ